MSYLIDTSLKFTIMDADLSINDCVGDLTVAYETGNKEAIEKAWDQYHKFRRFVALGYLMLLDGKFDNWNWQWAADEGHLCDMDWVWFKRDLENANVNKEQFDKKWKTDNSLK